MSEDAHARPSGDAPEPLYDVNIPVFVYRGQGAGLDTQ